MSYKYCQFCGTANKSTNKFCENCGSNLDQIPAAAPASAGIAPMSINKRKGPNLKILIPVIVGVLLLVGGGVFAYFHFFNDKTIDLTAGFDDKVLNLSGYDGEGTILDEDIDRIRELQGYNDADDEMKDFLNSVEYSHDKQGEDELSNGVKVTVTAKFDMAKAEEYGIKVRNAENGEVQTKVTITSFEKKPEEEGDNYQAEDQYSESYDDYSSDSGDDYEDEKRTADDGAYYTVSDTELSASDISDWSDYKIQMYINYIYTKHGYELGDSTESAREQKDHFETLDWYNNEPKYYKGDDDQAECEKEFTDIEKHNNKVLGRERNKRR